jgi:hypothetical protein
MCEIIPRLNNVSMESCFEHKEELTFSLIRQPILCVSVPVLTHVSVSMSTPDTIEKSLNILDRSLKI